MTDTPRSTVEVHMSCAEIAAAYGDVLENVPFGIGMTLPSAALPFPTNIIKEALSSMASQTRDVVRREQLKSAFFDLAYFIEDGYRYSPVANATPLPTEIDEARAALAQVSRDLIDGKAISEAITEKMRVLEAEWPLRLELCAISEAKRVR